MSTAKRLTDVLSTSKKLYFDKDSRIVLMSDCHRGDGSWGDNFLKNQNLYFAALRHYFENGFTYIELGDGDELWENRRLEQIIQIHSNSYWLLSQFYQEGRLFLLYGNHDIVKRNTRYTAKNCSSYYCESSRKDHPLFPGLTITEGLILSDRSSGKELLLTHGHQGDLLNDSFWRISRFLVRYLWKRLELAGVLDPTSAAKNYKKKGRVERRLMQWSKKEQHMLVCGHTHRPCLPNTGETPYFNTGSCVHPRCITAIEIENSRISLVKWTALTDQCNRLYVGREVLAGPIPLKDYPD